MPRLSVNDIDLYVRPCEEGDVETIAPNIRVSDVIEIAAMMGPHKTTQEHLQSCIEQSKETYALVYNKKIISLWGVSNCHHVTNFGVPWLIGTDDISEVSRKFIRHSVGWIKHLSKDYEALYNFVHVPHWQSQKWLQLCGFNIVNKYKYGFNGEDFYLFIKECA